MIPLIEAVSLFCLGTLAIANTTLHPWTSSTSLTLHPILPAFHTVISLYLIAELLFFIYGKFRARILHNLADPPPPHHQVAKHLERFLMLNNVIDIEDFLRGWYLDTLPPSSTISRTTVETLVTYGFYSVKNGDINQLDLKYQTEVKQFVKDVEKKWNVSFPDDDEDDDEEEMEKKKKGTGEKEKNNNNNSNKKKRNPKPITTNIKFMEHLYEPLKVFHKPLLVYAVTETLAVFAHILLFLMGFRRIRHDTFSIWTCQPKHNKGDGVSLQHNTNTNDNNNNEGMVEHAFEAALDATSVVAAQVSTQHPHSGQQYHIVQDDDNVRRISSSRRRRNNNSTSSTTTSSTSSQSESGGGPRHRASSSSSSFTLINDNPATTTDNGSDTNNDTTNTNTTNTNTTTTTTPIVFIHGVGTGLLPYLHFIHQLMKNLPTSPIIAIEVPHISLRLCWQAAAVDHVADAAITALKAKGYSKACFIGHSYGTFVVSRICQRYQQYIHSTVVWDPVTMLICHPQLLYNFIYKSPGKRELFTAVGAADAIRVLCSRDLVIAHTFCRRFHWAELMLWPEELPERSVVILSGKDDLVPSEMVAGQLRESKHPAKVIYYDKLGHGGLLLCQKSADRALLEIEKMVRM